MAIERALSFIHWLCNNAGYHFHFQFLGLGKNHVCILKNDSPLHTIMDSETPWKCIVQAAEFCEKMEPKSKTKKR